MSASSFCGPCSSSCSGDSLSLSVRARLAGDVEVEADDARLDVVADMMVVGVVVV